ncbi:unnamed protein product [Vitrella brassicaformis CCMP3155]|uniref:TLDc domain-containing protein n=1 Tax=Vitrella brassicaformis (strain CCMP3155) TaxID=1169540 RepID=A0A0G4EWL5_VITBC|nr:unnamed protein product [Vitrella brassicaformis CCMP3155]|eukprot:CEM02454.1 unnamed protein product [Vitrella brassicaformis CCMP3155]
MFQRLAMMLSASGVSRRRRSSDRQGGSAPGAAASSADSSESVAPCEPQLQSLTCGREEGDLVLKEAAGCIGDLREMAKTATREAMGEMEQLAEEIKQLFVANGGSLQPRQTEDRLRLNVGGTVMSIPVSALLHPKMKQTYLSTLLLHFSDQLPKDANQLPFLEMHPAYFRWLRDQLALLESPHLDEISLHSPEADDPSYAEYHSLFMRTLGGAIEIGNQPQSTGTAAEGGGEGGAKRGFRQMEQCMRRYEGLLEGLRKQKEKMEAFLVAMRPFVKGDSSDEDTEVMTLSVSDEDVSVLRRTIALCGPDHVLVKRFDRTQWPDQEVRQTSLRFLQLVVDFGRRLSVMPAGRFVHPPVVAAHEKEMFAVELGMYGLNTMPPVGEAAGASAVIKTADEWLAVMAMTDKKIAVAPSLLYKSSRDTFAYPSFLNKVTGKSGLLLALRDGDTHRFGCFIDGQIRPPDDFRQANYYDVPVFFYSLSGAYETPTKIEVPEEKQQMEVAGTQGVAKANNMDWSANVCIAGGQLWLGWAQPGPAADLSRCQQWTAKKGVPDGYKGTTVNEEGAGTLASRLNFTCSEMEVWQMGSG